MKIDDFLDRFYDRQRYTCFHFTREVWKELTGEDLGEELEQVLNGFVKLGRKHVRKFVELSGPQDPCLVVMQWVRSPPHLGVYLRGRVLHLQRHGVEFQPLGVADRGFTSTRFVLCRN